jgi:ankyrin repeat protein
MGDKQKQLVDSATCDVVSDALDGKVDAVRKWLHNDKWNNKNKQAIVLVRAAMKGHTDICQVIIDCATVPFDNLTSALHQACYHGQLSVVQLIVNALGHDCNSQLLNDSLHLAVLRNHAEIVNWLLPLTHPTDADCMRWDLVQASARGDLKRVTQLVNTIGPDVTDVMSHALWAACYNGRVEIVNWLMTHTSNNVNYSRVIYFNTGSMTSLAVACYQGHMTVVKQLLTETTSQCDVNMASGKRYNTALHEVIWHTQMTPLHWSCYNCDAAAVADVVYKSDVNMQDGAGRTAIHHACMNEHLDLVKVLLSVFADTNITNDFGKTPVALCEYYGSPELADYIQNNHLMHVSDDAGNNSSVTVSGQVDHNNTNIQV